jgi:hypothetical protein
MGFYSRQNAEQSRLTDEVYAVIQRHNSLVLGTGVLTQETEQDQRSILAALDLLVEEGKVTITLTPKGQEIRGLS